MKLLIITQKIDSRDPILGFFHRWIEEFAKHCEHIHAVCLFEGEHSLPNNVHVHSLGKEKGVGKIGRVIQFYSYVFSLRKEYDAVFVHMNPIYIVLAGWIWGILGKRIALWYTHKHVDIKLKIAHLFVSKIFTASKDSFRFLSEKVEVVGHGIDTKWLNQVIDIKDTLNIITIGRLSPIKRVEDIIQAVQHLHDNDIKVHFDVIGGPVYEREKEYAQGLQTYVDDNNLTEYVTFHGAIPHDQIKGYLLSADVFVNASETGSLDKAGLEAMSVGIPLVTSNVAFRDMLGVYEKELFFKSRDPDMLSRKLEKFSKSEKKREIVTFLQEKVREAHSLEKLIPHLIISMKNI